MKNKTKITSTILLSALLLGVAVTSMNFSTAYAGPVLQGPICIDAATGLQVGTLGNPLQINRPPDNGPMEASSPNIICNLSATIWISPDCQFDEGDAGQLLVYTSGPATITRGPSTLSTLAGAVLNPGDDVHPDDLEPLLFFGLVPIHPDLPGTYVITGISTGVDNPNGAPIAVTIEVIEKIETTKVYTFTDVEPFPIDELTGLPLPSEFGTPLPIDEASGKFLLKAVVKKNGDVSSYNPGQYYARTTVVVNEDLDELWIFEDFSDCIDKGLSKVNPPKAPGGVIVLIENPDGTTSDPSDELADLGKLSVNTVLGMAEVHLDNVLAGSTVHFYVKFSPGLKGDPLPDPEDSMCENWEFVTAYLTFGLVEESIADEAHANLIVLAKERPITNG